MAKVTNDSAKKYRYLGREDEVESSVEEREETLRDKLLKKLLVKQLDARISLQETLKCKKEFLKSSTQESSKTRGLLSYEDFSKISEENTIREVLATCDLTQPDIDYLLDGTHPQTSINPDADLQKLKLIEEKLAKRQLHLQDDRPEHFSGAVPLTRHEYEEEIRKEALSGTAEKLSSCLVYLKPYSSPFLHPDHPLNKLPQLEKELFPHPVHSSREKKKRKLDTAEPEVHQERPKKSLWDIESPTLSSKSPVQEYPEKLRNKPKKSQTLIIVKRESTVSTDYSKPFIWPLAHSDLIPLRVVKEKSLTIEQIRSIDLFRDYDPGSPSRTLFLKNLPRKVSPRLLASLFGNFECESGFKIQYRILRGRMQGQAFVRLKDEETAGAALRACLGYPVDGKPLVILYGKKSGMEDKL